MRTGIFTCLVQGCTPNALEQCLAQAHRSSIKLINDYHMPIHIQRLLMTYRIKNIILSMAFKVLY